MNHRAASTLVASTFAEAEPASAACAVRAEVTLRLASARALVPHAPPGPGELTILATPNCAPEATLRVGEQSIDLDAGALGLASTCSFGAVQGWTSASAGPGLSLLFDGAGALRYARLDALEALGPGCWSITEARLATTLRSH